MGNTNTIDITFCRQLLKGIMPDVQKHTTKEERKNSWTWHYDRDQWEFHGPGEFFWSGSASNGYDARYHGWFAYLAKLGVEGYKE